MDRIKNNNEFYPIKLLNSVKIKVNKNTNEVYFIDRGDIHPRILQSHIKSLGYYGNFSQQILSAHLFRP